MHDMRLVKRRRLLAHGRALARVVGPREESHPDVARRALDRAAELRRAREARVGGWGCVLGVPVGPGDHDVEVVLVLPGLRRHAVGHARAPERAFVVHG